MTPKLALVRGLLELLGPLFGALVWLLSAQPVWGSCRGSWDLCSGLLFGISVGAPVGAPGASVWGSCLGPWGWGRHGDWGARDGRPNSNGPPPPSWGLGLSAGPWGGGNRNGSPPLPPPWGLGPFAGPGEGGGAWDWGGDGIYIYIFTLVLVLAVQCILIFVYIHNIYIRVHV